MCLGAMIRQRPLIRARTTTKAKAQRQPRGGRLLEGVVVVGWVHVWRRMLGQGSTRADGGRGWELGKALQHSVCIGEARSHRVDAWARVHGCACTRMRKGKHTPDRNKVVGDDRQQVSAKEMQPHDTRTHTSRQA